jgi:hypothetical protein
MMMFSLPIALTSPCTPVGSGGISEATPVTKVDELFNEENDVNALSDDQPEVERCLQPAAEEDEGAESAGKHRALAAFVVVRHLWHAEEAGSYRAAARHAQFAQARRLHRARLQVGHAMALQTGRSVVSFPAGEQAPGGEVTARVAPSAL